MEQQHDRAELDRTRLEEQLAKMRYQLQKSNRYVDILRSYVDSPKSNSDGSKSSRYASNDGQNFSGIQHTCKHRSKSTSPSRMSMRASSAHIPRKTDFLDVKPVNYSKSCRKIRFDDSSDPQVSSYSAFERPYSRKQQQFHETFYQLLMRPEKSRAVVDSPVDYDNYYQSSRDGDKSTFQRDSGAVRTLPRLSRQDLSWNRGNSRHYSHE